MVPLMTDQPLVSIIIPVYNGANYLGEAIDSALAQTYKNIEVLVVNDGSADDGATEEIAQFYGTRIRYFGKKNGGVASALNVGIREMKGEYFAWLSHDDVYLPVKIERQVQQLQQFGRDVILYGDYNFIDEASKHLSIKRISAPHPSEFHLSLLYSHPVHGCTLLIPRQFLLESGMFDETLRTIQDYDLWFRMAYKYEFIHIPEILINSRVHSEQGIRASRPLCLKECGEFYLKRLKEIVNHWDSGTGESTKLVFLIKVAIFLERCGHKQPLRYCRSELSDTFGKAFPLWDWTGWYWLIYFGLFRAKRLVWR